MASQRVRTALASSFPIVERKASKPCPKLVFDNLSLAPKLSAIRPASQLAWRAPFEMVSSGIREMDEFTGGLPRGALTEICGMASSGRTSMLLAALAAATRRQEVCALIDVSDACDPHSAAAAGVDFERLLWVRCGSNPEGKRKPTEGNGLKNFAASIYPHGEAKNHEDAIEQSLRVADLVLQSGGFGLVAIDLSDVSPKAAQRIPLASWFRFQRAVEHTPTILFVSTPSPCARTCASLLLKLEGQCSVAASPSLQKSPGNREPAHAQLLGGLRMEGELLRSRIERKPQASITSFFSPTAWAAG
jgi:recombination protein RecA